MIVCRAFCRVFIVVLTAMLAYQNGLALSLSGTITDSVGTPISGAAVKLEVTGTSTTSAADGKFTLSSSTARQNIKLQESFATLKNGQLFVSLSEKAAVSVVAYGINGEQHFSIDRQVDAGSQAIALPSPVPAGVAFYRVSAGNQEQIMSVLSADGELQNSSLSKKEVETKVLAKTNAPEALYDVITVTKTGYLKAYRTITISEMTGVTIKMLKETTPKFSFFVTSLAALQDLSDTVAGFGGDFRFGETGPGAGLRGADKICDSIAERSMKGSSVKGWRAFLSVTADAYGKPVNAIDRVGTGPWYDRTGRVFALAKNDLLTARPTNIDAAIKFDLPNENGIPNHRPDPTKPAVDNHHFVTGSNTTGKLKSATATCKDWTTSNGSATNGKPSCGFAWPRSSTNTGSGYNWMTTWDAPGCAAGIDVASSGGAPPGSIIIGGGGGYGGFYCFALNP